MGHLKDIANQPKLQSFPDSTFEIEGEPPESQCSEAKIEGDNGQTIGGQNFLIDTGAFVGFNLIGKVLHITAPPANVGDYAITANTDDLLTLGALTPFSSSNNVYFVTNGGALILTRDLQSFAQFITAAGYPYTIKGGKLYTTIPSAVLQNACTIVFDPLT